MKSKHPVCRWEKLYLEHVRVRGREEGRIGTPPPPHSVMKSNRTKMIEEWKSGQGRRRCRRGLVSSRWHQVHKPLGQSSVVKSVLSVDNYVHSPPAWITRENCSFRLPTKFPQKVSNCCFRRAVMNPGLRRARGGCAAEIHEDIRYRKGCGPKEMSEIQITINGGSNVLNSRIWMFMGVGLMAWLPRIFQPRRIISNFFSFNCDLIDLVS